MEEKKTTSTKLEYTALKVEVIEMEMEGTILNLSSSEASGPGGPSMSRRR